MQEVSGEEFVLLLSIKFLFFVFCLYSFALIKLNAMPYSDMT